MGNILDALKEESERKKLYGEICSPLENLSPIRDYLDSIGAYFTKMKTAEIREWDGRYSKTIATIRFDLEKCEVRVWPKNLAPEDKDLEKIKKALSEIDAPNSIPFPKDHGEPEAVSKAKKNVARIGFQTVYTFNNKEGLPELYIIRTDNDDGTKSFVPVTYWSDDEVRKEGPDGLWPIYGLEHVEKGERVIVHEGMSSAAFWQNLLTSNNEADQAKLDEHPFADFLKTGKHVGWHGGATNPFLTDWASLTELHPSEVIIVSDNDRVGKEAGYKISQALGTKTKIFQFTDQFPKGFDLADEVPKSLYHREKSNKYVGPDISNLLHPATWAVYTKPAKPKPINSINPAFLAEWVYVSDPDIFVHQDFPDRHLSQATFNKVTSRFSNEKNVAGFLLENRCSEVQSLAYDPASPSGIIQDNGKVSFNVYRSPRVIASDEPVDIFLEFMSYLFPNASDRHEIFRWLATLIARPETRMHYSLLLISEAQGTGKTTLAEHIAAKAIGYNNVSFPSEHNILSEFNSWAGFKRLAIVAEIYQGQSWKCANTLKSYITDKTIAINKKHQSEVTVLNKLHIIACSNSARALKMDVTDRRWLVPQITERPWSKQKFVMLFQWLETGGLEAIVGWAQGFGDYVEEGDTAPISEVKKSIIAESRSEHLKEAIAILEPRLTSDKPMALSVDQVIAYVRSEVPDKCYDSGAEFKKTLKEVGWSVFPERLSFKGKNVYVLQNHACAASLDGMAAAEAKARLRELLSLVDLHTFDEDDTL